MSFHIGPSPFHAWGWPWRGLGVDYQITGYAGQVFQDGQSWLLDLGLPAVSLTPEESVEAAVNGWTWQNYGHISGGYLYGHNLQQTAGKKDTFIYVDGNGDPFKVRVILGFEGGDVVSVQGEFIRFGHFGEGEVPSFFKAAANLTCDDITPLGGGETRVWTVEDVWTNGSKALVSIGITYQPNGYPYNIKAIYSLIEIQINGTGQAGITLEATEIRGGLETSGTVGDGLSPIEYCTGGCNWHDFERTTYTARFAYYRSNGTPVLFRLKATLSRIYSNVTCGALGTEVRDEESYQFCEDSATVLTLYSRLGDGPITTGCFLDGTAYALTGFIPDNIDLESGSIASGAQTLLAFCAYATPFDFASAISVLWWIYDTVTADEWFVGFVRGASNAYALYIRHPDNSYVFSQVITPHGNVAWPGALTAPGQLHHAWNRKTGDYSFNAEQICYV